MAGSEVGDPEGVGEGEDKAVAEGLGPDSGPEEHATRAAMRSSGATRRERSLMCSLGRRVDRERFQPVSVTGQLALEAR
jgi:hypothetical protein